MSEVPLFIASSSGGGRSPAELMAIFGCILVIGGALLLFVNFQNRALTEQWGDVSPQDETRRAIVQRSVYAAVRNRALTIGAIVAGALGIALLALSATLALMGK